MNALTSTQHAEDYQQIHDGIIHLLDNARTDMYLNYAQEHWTMPGENPPVGLILCAEKGVGEAHYALTGLPHKVLTSKYKMQLPDEKLLADELVRSQTMLEAHKTN